MTAHPVNAIKKLFAAVTLTDWVLHYLSAVLWKIPLCFHYFAMSQRTIIWHKTCPKTGKRSTVLQRNLQNVNIFLNARKSPVTLLFYSKKPTIAVEKMAFFLS